MKGVEIKMTIKGRAAQITGSVGPTIEVDVTADKATQDEVEDLVAVVSQIAKGMADAIRDDRAIARRVRDEMRRVSAELDAAGPEGA